MVFSVKKFRKLILAMVGLFAIGLAGAAFWSYKSNLENAKVDRSNAMQVTKSVINESATPVISTDFFTEYRLERDKMRSERSDVLRESIKNAKNDDIRQRAQETVLKMVQEKQREAEMESLIKARGFADALVFYRENSVNAIVKASSLSREEVIQVADVISRVSGVKPEDITISAKP